MFPALLATHRDTTYKELSPSGTASWQEKRWASGEYWHGSWKSRTGLWRQSEGGSLSAAALTRDRAEEGAVVRRRGSGVSAPGVAISTPHTK